MGWGGGTICGTSGVRAAGGQWKGFDLLINGGYSRLQQVVNVNAGHFSNRFLWWQKGKKNRALNAAF